MSEAYQTPHQPVSQLVTGHFRETASYRTWRPHGTSDWLLIYTIGGSGRFGYEGGQIATEAGDMVLLQPRTLHDYGAAVGDAIAKNPVVARAGRLSASPSPGTPDFGELSRAGEHRGEGSKRWPRLPNPTRGGTNPHPNPLPEYRERGKTPTAIAVTHRDSREFAGALPAARRSAAAIRWDLLWTHFHPRGHWHEWLVWPPVAPGLSRLRIPTGPPRRRIAARFAEVHRLATGALRRRDDFAMNALEELLLLCDAHNPASAQFAIDARVRSAMDFVCGHLGQKIVLQDIADAASLSVSRLAHLFRLQVGTTPQRFLELQRLTRARQLLELTSQSIKEISQEVGFESPFYFTLRFKRYVGVGPKSYRNRGFLHGPKSS